MTKKIDLEEILWMKREEMLDERIKRMEQRIRLVDRLTLAAKALIFVAVLAVLFKIAMVFL